MCINNEVGSIQPIEEIKNVLKDHPLVKFHVDMVQALGKIKIDLKGIDCASFSAHKINGLKGSGLLFKRNLLMEDSKSLVYVEELVMLVRILFLLKL